MKFKKDLYRLLFESSSEAILLMQDGHCVECNNKAGELFSCLPNELIDKTLLDLAPATQPDGRNSAQILETKQVAALSGQVQQFDYLYQQPSAETFYAQVTMKGLEVGGKPLLYVSLLDITKRQESLERRGRQMRLVTQVSQAIAGAADLDDLYQRIVTEVKEQFHYYHTQLLLYDQRLNAVVLVAGYGETGIKMLAEGHQLRLGTGLVGLAAASGTPVLRSSVSDDPTWRPNAMLPHTKGELAVPIKLGEQVLGVLDVQSEVDSLLDADDQLLLESLCGQIAIAIESTRLREEMKARLRELSTLQQITTYEGWKIFQQEQDNPVEGYLFDLKTIQPANKNQLADNGQISSEQASVTDGLVKPMTVHGLSIGGLGVYDDPDNPLSAEDEALLEAVSSQVAQALDRARLLEQTQKQAAEAAIRERYQKSVAQVASILTEQGLEILDIALELLGHAAQVSLVYYFETREDENGLYWRQVSRWVANNVVPSMAERPWEHLPIDKSSYVPAELRSQGMVVRLIQDMTSEEQGVWGQYGTLSVALLAVQGQHGVPGFLSFHDVNQQRIWQEDELAALQTAAAALTNTLSTQTALAETEGQAQRLAELNDMGRALNLADTEDQVLNIAANYAAKILGADRTRITLLKEIEVEGDLAHQSFVLQQGVGLVPLEDPPAYKGSVAEKAIIENNLVTNFASSPDSDAIQSTMAAPVIVGGKAIACLEVGRKRTNAYRFRDETLFLQVVSLLSSSLENKRLFKQMQATLDETEKLYDTSRKINAASNWQEVVAAVAVGLPIPGINRVTLFTFEHDPTGAIETVTVAANWYSGEGSEPLPINTSYTRTVFGNLGDLLSQDPLFIDDVEAGGLKPQTLTIFKEQITRTMIILPLQTTERQLGVLTLQGESVHHFSEQEVQSYLSIIRQITAFVQNERLLTETRTALAEVEATQRRYTIQAWEAYRQSRLDMGYEQVRPGVMPMGDELPPEVNQAIQNKQTVVVSNVDETNKQIDGSEGGSSVIVPIKLRDEVIGILGLQESDEARQWLPEEVALVEAIATQFAQTADNFRLLDDTQRRVARETRINEIGEKIQSTQSLEEALQVAIKEVGKTLQVPQTMVWLNTDDD